MSDHESEYDRRTFVGQAATVAGAAAIGVGCQKADAEAASSPEAPPAPAAAPKEPAMTSPILAKQRLGNPPWPTEDPFLFCVHHDDAYPKGNAQMGPAASLAGREIGMDFSRRDGWSMYHGDVVPGFPRHPHRGFETVTVARQGYIDHSDSLGATARYGGGDCQWMTAGAGIVHSEMFPLISESEDNPCELFQLWLNLPAASKMAQPYFEMLWREEIPVHRFEDEGGRITEVTTLAGSLAGRSPPSPPPNSWGANPDAHVAIWTLRFQPGAKWTMPAADPSAKRNLYFFEGEQLTLAGETLQEGHKITVRPDVDIPLEAGPKGAQVLLLQGKPIGEPVAHHGPFVMNSRQELVQAFQDYQRTGFGGWPWKGDAPVHDRKDDRFALRPDGKREVPKKTG